MGAFVNRIIKELEKAHPGSAVKVSERAAAGLDEFAAKLKQAGAAGKLDDFDRAAIRGVTEDLLRTLPKNPETGKVSVVAVRNLQRSYSHSLLVEFGEGPTAEAATKAFRDSVNDVLSGTRPKATSQVDARVEQDIKKLPVRVRAEEARAEEGVGLGAAPKHGHQPGAKAKPAADDNQTAAEKAARAKVELERANSLVDMTFGARTKITNGIRTFDQGGFAEKKAAFDLIDGNMEGSGYIKRPQNAAEANAMAQQAAAGPGRSIEEIKQVLLSRPGMGPDGKFIDGIVTVQEWSKLRGVLKGELLGAEQKAVTNQLEVIRAAATTKLKPEQVDAAFTRLRAIIDDPDYQAAAPNAAHGPKKNTPKETQAALLVGQKVSREDLTTLQTYFNRYHVEQPPVTQSPGLLSRGLSMLTGGKLGGSGSTSAVKEPSILDRTTEWNHGFRVATPGAAGLRTAGGLAGGAAALTVAASMGTVILDPDSDMPVLGSAGRGLAAVTPLGFANVPGASLLPELYYSKMDRDPAYRAKALAEAPGSRNASKDAAVAVVKDKEELERTATGKLDAARLEATKKGIEQGATDFVASVTSNTGATSDKGVNLNDREEVLIGQYEAGAITASQMDELATRMAKASSLQGDESRMSKTEYELFKRDPAYTGLDKKVQTVLDQKFEPKF